ncbi:hemerythrin domain-containing protein [Streptomyces pseudogriseolus]|uniref:hemerythrin domain-containing protein n=1 Tax=Streptomyces pseudogriseolus TaxID=36817 RepID=UPI003FA33743
MGHGGDVIAELTTDHREVEELFGKIEALPSGDEQRKKYADQAVIELVRHSIAEEAYLYPAVREFLPNGDGIADKELEDHAEAERTMKDLEAVDAGDPECWPRARAWSTGSGTRSRAVARTDPPRRRAVSRPRVRPHLRRPGSGRRRNAVMDRSVPSPPGRGPPDEGGAQRRAAAGAP